MRLMAVAGLLALAGCVSPEMEAMQGACAAGNLQACYAAESLDQQRRQNLAARLDAMTLSGGAGAMSGMRTTNCRPTYGGGLNCMSY